MRGRKEQGNIRFLSCYCKQCATYTSELFVSGISHLFSDCSLPWVTETVDKGVLLYL
jgi:hypothetical protein